MKSGSRGNRDRVAILPLLSSANASCGEDWLQATPDLRKVDHRST